MEALETADRTQPTEVAAKTERLREKIDKLREQMRNLDRTAESLQSANLITIQDLKEADVRAIWNLVGALRELARAPRPAAPHRERPHIIMSETDVFASVHNEAVLVSRRFNATIRVLDPA